MGDIRRVERWAPRFAVLALLFTVVVGITNLTQAGDGGGNPPFPIPDPLNDTTQDTTHPTFVQ